MLDKNTEILIVGLGVIGGGYATALTNAGYTVRCITKNQEDIDYALARGMIKEGSTDADPRLIGNADLVICALYPTTFIDWVTENQKHFKSGALLTDVTGVKGVVVDTVQAMLRPDVEFIAAHPMAGRERSGVEYSDPAVFRGANYIVTPTEKNSEAAIGVCKEIGEVLGFARISVLTPQEHDKMIAFLSQLTHIIAVSLMNCNSEEGLEKYTGDSFRDLTRIAKINDLMWSELFMLNKDALIEQIDAFSDELSLFREMLINDDKDGMREKMRASTARRSLFDKPKM
ncbi:MAG: prephenate dehydrogenase [Clostridia bacterium]|nr:prephenate dehydrogenase [Clostridia bacterium]